VSSATNDIPNIKRQRSGVASKLFYTNINKTDNPLDDVINDKDKLKQIFKNYPFIPYNGTNQNPQNTMLSVLDILSKLSPTQSSVLNSMSFYLYGGKVGLVESVDTEFALEQNVIEGNEAKQYFESLMTIKPEHGFRELAKSLFKSRKYCGEHYIRINYYQVAGQKKVKIEYLNPLNVMPTITEDGQQDTFITFDEFNNDTIINGKYDIVGKYPYITFDKDYYSTIIQYKNGSARRGRPVESAIVIDQYREYKDNLFLTRQSANNFTPQVFIEQEEADPAQTVNEDRAAIEAQFDNYLERFIANTTNNGDDPQSVLLSNRPFGTKEAFIYEFKQNTSEKWFNITGSITEKRIIKAHGWSDKLMGDSDVGTGLNSSAIIETLKVKLPLIEAQTSIEENTINIAIDSAFRWLGINFDGVDIKFNNPYQSMIDSIGNTKV
jgi:hypothetical protein